MLKLNASYSKKVPAETEYSSKSYHCSIEVELPDGLSPEQLQDRIGGTFELVRDSVESELGGGEAAGRHNDGQRNFRKSGGNQQRFEPASEKQMRYLTTLGSRRGMDEKALAEMAGLESLDQLGRKECSRLIDDLNGAASRAA